MPVRVTLRTGRDSSPFRVLLRKLIELPDGDSVVLCSGYIQEVDPSINTRSYNLSEDQLLASLKKGCHNGKVTTVAGKLKHYGKSPSQWEKKYTLFIQHLKAAGLNVEAWSAPKKNWHAKIAIRLKNDTPIAILLGSSNLTRPAFGIDNYPPRFNVFKEWNFEGDVLIWDDPHYNGIFKEPIDPQQRIGDMVLVLDREVRQPDEQQQLWKIYKYVMDEITRFEPLER